MSNPEEVETVASPAAESIASHEYLLEEILVLLPAKSLGRFKLVSKQWRYLISNPKLISRKSPIGMFLGPRKVSSLGSQVIDTKFVPFRAADETTIPSLEFLKNRRINSRKRDYDIEIRQSINGLLLCLIITAEQTSYGKKFKDYDYVVCNPTTKQFRLLPRVPYWQNFAISEGVLAFDPSISIHYKLICRRNRLIGRGQRTLLIDDDFMFDIYSSEDNSWREFRNPFQTRPWDCGCYLNGSIYWMDLDDEGEHYLRFDVKAEKMTKMRASHPGLEDYLWGFINETGSSLYCAVKDKFSAKEFLTVELKIDSMGSCKWVAKNEVCVSDLVREYPQVAAVKEEEQEVNEKGRTRWAPGLRCLTLCVVEGQKEEEVSALVLAIPGKVISYNFKHKTVEELCDLEGDLAGYRNFQGFLFRESFFPV